MPENRALNYPVNPPVLHHTTFTTLKMDQMVEWYGLVCGLLPVFHFEGAAWLTNDAANHRIALLSPPGLKDPVDKGHTTGLHHTAFEFATFDMWLNNYVRLRDHGILPFLTLDHGITMSLYYQDPDGNGVELQVDAFGDWADSKEWMAYSADFAVSPIGTYFDPEKLVDARANGMGFKEIHERTRAGEFEPAVIPEDIFLPEAW